MNSDADVPPEDAGDAAEGPDLDIDAAFAAIVAAWDSDTPKGQDAVGRWPVVEDVGPASPDSSGANLVAPTVAERDAPPTVWRQGPDPLAEPVPLAASSGPDSDNDQPGEDDETFIPPEPLPLPKGDLMLRAAWAGVIAGPLFLLGCLFFMAKPLPTWTIIVGVGGFVAGFLVLVARMPDSRDDDGAVV